MSAAEEGASGAGLAQCAAAVSTWLDGSPGYVGIDPEAHRWRRVAKIGEEAGEVINALLGTLGENPRKGRTHGDDDLIGEVLDVAFCAIAAVEHLTGNRGESARLLVDKARYVCARVGLAPADCYCGEFDCETCVATATADPGARP